jgi:hypothetical protein
MKKQTGARFLHKAKNRTDSSFSGLVKLANPKASMKLNSGARKRLRA